MWWRSTRLVSRGAFPSWPCRCCMASRSPTGSGNAPRWRGPRYSGSAARPPRGSPRRTRGMIHRDIKPGNIWLDEGTGRVKILDFGLACFAEEAGRLTQDGTILGTPAFMAPEQASGGARVDHRSDLFSLGAVLYRITTGRHPFGASSTAAVILALSRDDPVPPRQLNPAVPPPRTRDAHRSTRLDLLLAPIATACDSSDS